MPANTSIVPRETPQRQPGDVRISPNYRNAKHAPEWRALLYARGLSDAAIERAGLRPSGAGWCYPLWAEQSAQRWKAFPGRRGAKYLWKPSKPDRLTFYDPRGDLAAHVAAAGGAIILAGGEPDVWALWTAGLFNATCTLHGEGTIPAWLVDDLRALGAQAVRAWPDRDRTGAQHAAKLAAALRGSGIALDARELPARLGDAGDINKLLVDVGAAGLAAALDACPALEITPEIAPEPSPRRRGDLPEIPTDYKSLYDRWCSEVERAAIQAWNIDTRKKSNTTTHHDYSRKPIACPFVDHEHDTTRPAAAWDFTAHAVQCQKCGTTYNTQNVADRLGLPTWDDFKREHAPQKAAAPAPDARPYPHGFAWTMTRTLLTAKHTTVDGADLAGLYCLEKAIDIAGADLPEHASAADIVRLAAADGWSIDRRLVGEWLEWGTQRGMYKNAPMDLTPKTIGAKLYMVPPLGERLIALGDYLIPRMKAPRRAPARAGEIAAVLGQPSEGLEAIDELRAGALAAGADDRAYHEQRAARRLAVWQGNVSRILAGSYEPHELAPQRLSPPAVRATIIGQLLADGMEPRKLAAMTGASRNTVLKLARGAGYETVPQTVDVPSAKVNRTARARGLVVSESDGVATIQQANVLKHVDHLTDDERQAIEDQRAQQQRRNHAAQLELQRIRELHQRPERPQNALEARWRRDDMRHTKADGQAARVLARMKKARPKHPRPDPLDAWCDHQWELSPPLSPPPIDPETGEVLKGRARWLSAFETIRGGNMTFAHFSEPTEREPHEHEQHPAEPPRDELLEWAAAELGAVITPWPDDEHGATHTHLDALSEPKTGGDHGS